MVSNVLACERLADHGEIRCFLRERGSRAHYAIETFRDDDGRAWTLRVPVAKRAAFLGLVRSARRRLQGGDVPAFDDEGMALLAEAPLAEGQMVAALALRQEGEDGPTFALWRRELGGAGWWWTLDAVFVPLALGGELCALVEAAVAAA